MLINGGVLDSTGVSLNEIAAVGNTLIANKKYLETDNNYLSLASRR